MAARFVAVLVAFAITAPLQFWWPSAPLYVLVAVGMVAYFCVRYIAYFIRERRYIKSAMDAAKRDQISNRRTTGHSCHNQTDPLPGTVRHLSD
jgi:fatty acid desaturase